MSGWGRYGKAGGATAPPAAVHMTERPKPESVGLPIRPFLYTLDQIAALTAISEEQLARQYVYFEDRSTGVKRASMLMARNINAVDQVPEWRVAEPELIRWMRAHRFRVYERGYLRD